MRTKSTGGFTLIELLIVIAIIGILAAVLIPNLLGARQRALDTAAQTCARAIATGQEMRVIDDENYLAVTAANVGDLEGTNACEDDMAFANGAANGQVSYAVDVQHVSGSAAFRVTQNGVERLAARF